MSKAANLYICGFPATLKKEGLVELFQPFGKIVQSSILTNDQGESRCSGFVKYETERSAKNAIEKMNGKKLDGCSTTLKVRVANEKKQNFDHVLPRNADNEQNHTIFVFNLDMSVDDLILWQLFGPFGAISDCNVVIDKKTGKSKGYGFVSMINYDEALMAIQLLDGYSLNDRILQVNFKKPKNDVNVHI